MRTSIIAVVGSLILCAGAVAAESSAGNPQLALYLAAHPEADADHDGVLSAAEARAFYAKAGKAAQPAGGGADAATTSSEPAWMPYVRDPAGFAWSAEPERALPGGITLRTLHLTSQVWQGATWQHTLLVWSPARPSSDLALVIVAGKNHDPDAGAKLCAASGVVCASVEGTFQACFGAAANEGICLYAMQQYMLTGDPLWSFTAPSTKTLVRSMDALVAWSAQAGQPLQRFVLTGHSKMGLASWMTAALDARVAGVVPTGADMLNLPAQRAAHAGGEWKMAAALAGADEERFTAGLALLDPWTWRRSLTMPKLVVSGTNDGYYDLGSVGRYWDDLPGPKAHLYLPVSHAGEPGHPLTQQATAAFVRLLAAGKALPVITATVTEGGGQSRFTVTSSLPAVGAHLWSGPGGKWAEVGALAASADAPAGMAFSQTWERSAPVYAALDYLIDGQAFTLTTGLELVK